MKPFTYLRFEFIVVALCLTPKLVAGDRAWFSSLGSFSNPYYWVGANDISPDGTVALGQADGYTGDPHECFTWRNGQLTPIDPNVSAYAIANNGQVLAGTFISGNAFRWSAAEGFVDIGRLPGSTYAWAVGISNDGGVITGYTDTTGFRWTAATGMTSLGGVAGKPDSYCEALAVSGDGSTIVGKAYFDNSYYNVQAFRWAGDDAIEPLGTLPHAKDNFSNATGVSFDGSVIVGTSVDPNGVFESYRWTRATGMVGLGFLWDDPGYGNSAYAVSGDGEVIVGYSYPDAMMWDAQRGMRHIAEVLAVDYCLEDELNFWYLEYALAISDDGATIVGLGGDPSHHMQGWIAHIPRTVPCLTDINKDGVIDLDDIAIVLSHFGGSYTACGGDTNGDFVVDLSDLGAVLAAYGQTCP